jgi:hypothetical protein
MLADERHMSLPTPRALLAALVPAAMAAGCGLRATVHFDLRVSASSVPILLLDHGPQRFWTRAPERGSGVGLGLTIAAARARALGSELRLANDAGGGARIVRSTTERNA